MPTFQDPVQNTTQENLTVESTYTVGLAGSGAQYIASEGSAQTAINEALTAASQTGGKVHLDSGTYVINGHVEVGSDTIMEGDSAENTKIEVSSSSSQFFGLYGVIKQKTQPFHRIEIRNLWIDGNCENLPATYANYGAGDHNSERLLDLMGSKNAFSEDVYIHDCHFSDSFSDGAHLAFIHNARVENCTFENDQHSSCFIIDSTGEVSNCNIEAITDTGIRADNSPSLKIHDNHITSYQGSNNNGAFKDGQNGIQIADEGHSHGGGSAKPDATNNIEIYNNFIEHVGLAGLWMDTTGQSTNESVYVHHNTFKDCGYSSNAEWGSGISLHPWVNGAEIAYNTFDGCYQAAISVLSTIKTAVTVSIHHNNILNTKGNGEAHSGGLSVSQVGYGILNSANAALSTIGNFFSGNLKGDSDSQVSGNSASMVEGAGGNGASISPVQSVTTPVQVPVVKPTNTTTTETSNITESNLLFDLLNTSFYDSGIITHHMIIPDKDWQEKGKSKAWVDIVGWNNMTERDGIFYIPENEQPIVKYDAVCTAFSGKTRTRITTSENNGNTTADLEVKAIYKVNKKSSVFGKSVPTASFETRSQTSHYYDSEPMPTVFNATINSTAYVIVHDNWLCQQTLIEVPENPNVMKVVFKYGDTKTRHYLHTGTMNKTAKGVNYIEISDLNYWDDDDNVSYSSLVLSDALSSQELSSQVQIIQYDVYGREIPITSYHIEKELLPRWIVPPITFLCTAIIGIFSFGIYRIWKGFL